MGLKSSTVSMGTSPRWPSGRIPRRRGALAERLAALKASIAEILELIAAGEASVERLEQEEKRLRTVLDEQTEDLRMATEGGRFGQGGLR